MSTAHSHGAVAVWAAPLALGAWLCWPALPATAAQSRIELRDGSVLQGELISVGSGGYRIRSPSLGEIEIPESNVLAIRPLDAGQSAAPQTAPGGGAAGEDMQGQLAAIQQQLASDPAMLQTIMGLQNDPEIRAALADPGFTQLILSGNVQAIRNDPRFQRLMENAAIQGIVGRVKGQ